MTLWPWTLILVCILAVSCSSPNESEPVVSSTPEHWTSCIIRGGIGDVLLSAETELADGRIQNTESELCPFLEGVHTSQDLAVKEGRIRELRVRFSGTESQRLDIIYADIHERLVSLYGNSTPSADYASWRGASTKGTLIEIELMDGRSLFQVDAIIVLWQEYEDTLYED